MFCHRPGQIFLIFKPSMNMHVLVSQYLFSFCVVLHDFIVQNMCATFVVYVCVFAKYFMRNPSKTFACLNKNNIRRK